MRKVPRYSSFKPSSKTASTIKRANKARDTKPELQLRRELWRRGLRYRVHVTSLPGRPDIVFPRAKVAVFCDGDFWHGRNWSRRRARLERGSNAGYWVPKIEANVARDSRVNAQLRRLGWTVVRVWETDLRRDPDVVAERVFRTVNDKRDRGNGPV